MSETKAKVKVKTESETTTKLAKSSQAGDAPVKVKKEEPESPVAKKKQSEAPEKSVKKETNSAVKVSKKEESSKIKKSVVSDKVKVVKKEEALISVGTPPKAKKPSTDEPEKKEKKVYSLPGQKHDPPDERDPLRIFYESLYSQNSESEMAEIWMMEHGLLEHDVAKKAFDRKKKNQTNQKLGSPVKQVKEKSETKVSTAVVVKSQKKTSIEKPSKKNTTPNGESKPSKVKRERVSDDEDDDFILKPKKKSKANA